MNGYFWVKFKKGFDTQGLGTTLAEYVVARTLRETQHEQAQGPPYEKHRNHVLRDYLAAT